MYNDMNSILYDNFIYWSFTLDKKTLIKYLVIVMFSTLLFIDYLNNVSNDILWLLQILVLFDALISSISYLEKNNFHCNNDFFKEVNIVFLQAVSKGIIMLIIYSTIMILNYCTNVYMHLSFDFFSYAMVSVIALYIKYIICSMSNISFIKKIFGDKLIKLLEQKKF